MKKYFYFAFAILLNSCDHASGGKTGPAFASSSRTSSEAATPPPAAQQKGSYLKFKPAVLNDPASTGTALTLLIPDGWQMQGRVIWRMDNPAYPATSQLQATDATGTMSFEVFPMENFYYTRDPRGLRAFPYGSRYMGYLVVNEMPSTANAITKYLLPYYRKNVQGLKIVEEKVLMPEQAQSIGANKILKREGVVLRLEYTENGKPYEENVYGTRAFVENPNLNAVYWILTNCYGFKAPKGQLKAHMKLFQTMLSSIQIDKKWYVNCVQMSRELNARGVAQAKAAGERSKIMARASDAENKEISDSYWQQQKSNDLVNDKFADYERDVNTYIDPTSHEQYKLPAGYTNAWKNDLGEYIVSDVNGFDPGQISTQHWTELQQRQ